MNATTPKSQEPPPKKARPLPEDPEARAAVRASVRPAADTVLGFLSLLGAKLPPHRALDENEQTMLRPSLEDCLYRYGGEVDPLVGFALALSSVAAMRWVEWQVSKPDPKPENKTGQEKQDSN